MGSKSNQIYDRIIIDETLRDGVQAPYVKQPNLEQAWNMVELAIKLGIRNVTIGYAASNPTIFNRSLEIAKRNFQLKKPVIIGCAARTDIIDINPIINISQKVGHMIIANTFIGTDPNRISAEGWTRGKMIRMVTDSTKHAVKYGLETRLVTETSFIGIKRIPKLVQDIYLAGLHAGASTVCLCDTTGTHTPDEITEGIVWMRKLLNTNGFKHIPIHFHGHDDLGGAVPNSIAALLAGAQGVDATILGVGERRGNTDIIPLAVQMERKKLTKKLKLSVLPTYAKDASKALGIRISNSHPVIGSNTRCMVSGVHAIAVYKGIKKNKYSIYLPFNPKKIGLVPTHTVKIGQQAGRGNVLLFCHLNNLPIPREAKILKILCQAKKLNQRGFLSEKHIKKILSRPD